MIINTVKKPADELQISLEEIMELAQERARLQTMSKIELTHCARTETYCVDPLGGTPYQAGYLAFAIKPESE